MFSFKLPKMKASGEIPILTLTISMTQGTDGTPEFIARLKMLGGFGGD